MSTPATPPTPIPAPTDTITEAEHKVEAQAAYAVNTIEQDAIEFIKAANQHAKDAIPLLGGELGDGLRKLVSHAETLAQKHGFKL